MSKRDYKGELEEYLTFAPGAHGLDWIVVKEYRFHDTRRWRFDWALFWRDDSTRVVNARPAWVAVEYDGIMFGHASHSSMRGILRDAEKINEAQKLGWQVYRANAKTVEDGSFFELMDAVLMQRAEAA